MTNNLPSKPVDIPWGVQNSIASGWVIIGLEQYHVRLKQLGRAKQASHLREYIEFIKKEQKR